VELLAICRKRFWLQGHSATGLQPGHPERALVQALTRAHFPEALTVSASAGTKQAFAETQRLLIRSADRPLLGASFTADETIATADVLLPAGDDIWTLVEILPSLRIRERTLERLAFKTWVLERCGIDLAGIILRTINPRFKLERTGDYRSLFTEQHVHTRTGALTKAIPSLLQGARAILAGPEPEYAMGAHCKTPTPCPFAKRCSASLEGPKWPATILPDGGWKKWARKGFTDLLALDESVMKPREAMIVAATRSGIPFHDVDGARTAMAQWAFPRAWIDFEAASPAIPRWIGTAPYQQIPFQFSLHLEQADGTITHHEYLRCDGADPREGCARALVAAIPEGATLIAYNAGFERSILRGLARDVPDCADALLAIAERTVDLQPVARNHWYHRDQRGSWSLKAVLPTVAELDYEDLEVKGGAMAQDSFLEAISPETDPTQRKTIDEALRAYCRRDTWAMILIARRLAAGTDSGTGESKGGDQSSDPKGPLLRRSSMAFIEASNSSSDCCEKAKPSSACSGSAIRISRSA
jgi:hypothetical protein